MAWWQKLGQRPDELPPARRTSRDELAHYANGCYDVEYKYPWGWGELEGIATRTDYDLQATSTPSEKLGTSDAREHRPDDGPEGLEVHALRDRAGRRRDARRARLPVDAYHEEAGERQGQRAYARRAQAAPAARADTRSRCCRSSRRTACPRWRARSSTPSSSAGINARYDEQHAIGKRYRRHDEIGTPYCLTVDSQTADDDTVTIRDRDSRRQERIKVADALTAVAEGAAQLLGAKPNLSRLSDPSSVA